MDKALDGAWLKNSAIANNIANVNTPKYKKETVHFEDVLKNEINKNSSFNLAKTDSKHMDVGDVSEMKIEEINNTSYRVDDNNVDIDEENAELAKNTLYYNTIVNELSGQFSRLKTAMKISK